ncbi:sigma-54-dependent transcriptional regulator [Halorhodospira halophila]|uniref:sigma-54-dependent transcriptional regulator n=1 Tax=Halorhodospira halophila TaxID=1053 RepID=UPI001914D462|nr:sigma-54 dependent transcriptional regulator [Halorhodospira halophila]MBK5937302.1 response regulator [Halorhodospira halophila]
MADLLLIEDESVIRKALERLLSRHGYSVHQADSLEQAQDRWNLDAFDLILADMRLPGEPGTEAIERTTAPVIIMTSYASVQSAVEAMRQGAADYIAKPFDHDELLLLVERTLKEGRLQRQNAALKAHVERDYPVTGIVGNCEAMRAVFERIRKVAPTDTSVLILGESGTGKELVARALHEQSERHEGPLVAVNCAAIPDGLIEAELFGHERGAFTGAVGARAGLVESADGGTLFLDEIGELPQQAQGRLLRVLQEGEIRRIGSTQARRVNIRLVAATHRDLKSLAGAGEFREDLFFRINVMEIRLPPVRERAPDIPELARFLLEKTCQRLNRAPLELSQAAIDAMGAYSWPGNVREMENTIERAVILSEGNTISPDMLGLPAAESAAAGSESGATAETGPRQDLSLEDYFRQYVLTHQDHMTETALARGLGISRKALWEKRQRHGIPRPGSNRA